MGKVASKIRGSKVQTRAQSAENEAAAFAKATEHMAEERRARLAKVFEEAQAYKAELSQVRERLAQAWKGSIPLDWDRPFVITEKELAGLLIAAFRIGSDLAEDACSSPATLGIKAAKAGKAISRRIAKTESTLRIRYILRDDSEIEQKASPAGSVRVLCENRKRRESTKRPSRKGGR
jgi:hypothetical protein